MKKSNLIWIILLIILIGALGIGGYFGYSALKKVERCESFVKGSLSSINKVTEQIEKVNTKYNELGQNLGEEKEAEIVAGLKGENQSLKEVIEEARAEFENLDAPEDSEEAKREVDVYFDQAVALTADVENLLGFLEEERGIPADFAEELEGYQNNYKEQLDELNLQADLLDDKLRELLDVYGIEYSG